MRIQSNPSYYKLAGKGTTAQIEKVFEDMCLKDLTSLHAHKLIFMEEDPKTLKSTGMKPSSTPPSFHVGGCDFRLGLLFVEKTNKQKQKQLFVLALLEKGATMAKFYIKFETMVRISELPENANLEDLVSF